MKSFVFSLLLATISVNAFAFSTRMSCATDHHLTTSYAIIENDDNFELQVLHHNGLQFMPIHQGLITISDLDTLKQDSELFRLMGTRYVIYFKKSQCQITSVKDNNDWTCMILTPMKIGDLSIESLQFRVYKQQKITRKYNESSYIINLSFLKDGAGYTLPMEYAEKECRFKESTY